MRICSFLPSATEIVYALGLGDDLYGVTHECDYPSQVKEKPVVVRSVFQTLDRSSREVDAIVREYSSKGNFIYQIDQEALQQAQPDLVLTQGLCDVCAVSTEQVALAIGSLSRRPQVVSLDSHCLDDVFSDILKVGAATGKEDRAEGVVDSLRKRRDAVIKRAVVTTERPRVACLEWLDPLMVGGHWIPEMVELAGAESCFGQRGQPSFQVQWQQVVEAQPEIVVAMPCGFDVSRGVSEVHLITEREGWDSLPAAGANRLFVVDAGAYFSRAGPRVLDGLEIMAEIFHPGLFSGLVPQGGACRIYGQLFKVS